jgi:predicted dehydrogenase
MLVNLRRFLSSDAVGQHLGDAQLAAGHHLQQQPAVTCCVQGQYRFSMTGQCGWNHVVSQVVYETASASVEASCMLPQDYPFTAGLKLVCEKGVIEYHFRAGGASFEQGRPVSYLLLHEDGNPSQPIPFDAGDGYYNELAYFMECVKNGTPPGIVTPQDARLAVQTALACRQSLEEQGTTVYID